MSSPTWSHSGQAVGLGSPLRPKRSAVQHLFFSASQRKNLHLFGARELQTCCAPANPILPSKSSL